MNQDEIDAILKGAGNSPKDADDVSINEDENQENIIQQVKEEEPAADPDSDILQNLSDTNIEILLDIPLEVSVELGRTKIVIRDLIQIGPGSIIELDKLIGEPVDMLVNDNLIAKGEVVVFDENFGIRITDIVTPAQRLRSLK